jgi:hypothetical protein
MSLHTYRSNKFTLRSLKPYVKKACVHNDKFTHLFYFQYISVYTRLPRMNMFVRNVSENLSNFTQGLNVRMWQDIFWVIMNCGRLLTLGCKE